MLGVGEVEGFGSPMNKPNWTGAKGFIMSVIGEHKGRFEAKF